MSALDSLQPSCYLTKGRGPSVGVLFKLNIADDQPRLADSPTPRAHGVRPGRVRLDVRGAAALTLDGRHDVLTGGREEGAGLGLA